MSVVLDKNERIDSVLWEQVEEVRTLGVPRHVAIIMDGNRRWAMRHGVTSAQGHWQGASVIMDIVRFASDLGVKILTLYSFSTENWSRDWQEVNELMRLICFYLEDNTTAMMEESVRLETIGDLSKLPNFVQERIAKTKIATQEGRKITLVLALNYGSRDELKRAFVRMVQDLEKKCIVKEDISEELIAQYLDTARFGDPELFIRTSGEQRLSNFLLWQMSYTEVYIDKVLWPDFTKENLLQAICEFQTRHRRLGGT